MEVESKFNPDDWNGYLHTYETIEEYNAAKKLLPHTARIESTKEAKYIPKGEGLPTRYMYVDNINKSGLEFYNQRIDDYIDWVENHYFGQEVYNKIYKLIGKISIDQIDYYLWELIKEHGTKDCIVDSILISDLYRYAITTTISLGMHLNRNLERCKIISLTNDLEYLTFQNRTPNWEDVEGGDCIFWVIHFILDEDVTN